MPRSRAPDYVPGAAVNPTTLVAPMASTTQPQPRMSTKPRLAIFTIGGIGAGIASQGFPAIAAITHGLTANFDVDVYSLIGPDPGFTASHYEVLTPPRGLAGPRTRKLRWPYLAWQFLNEHRRRAYDILFSFWAYPIGPLVVALATLVRRPSVVTVIGAEAAAVPSIGYGHLRSPLTRRLVLATCEHASRLVVLSANQQRTLREHGLRRDDVQVIPFGADPVMFPLRPKRLEPPLKMLHVASLTEVKDQETLIHGFALLRRQVDARLRLVGPDCLGGRVQKLAADLQLQNDVEFVGPLQHGAIPHHHEWADMIVLTSLSEGQNNSLTEAALSGRLQVSTPVGHVNDLGENAVVIVRERDPADFAAKVMAILRDPAEWDRKVFRAHAWAASHDLRWTVQRLASVLAEAAASAMPRQGDKQDRQLMELPARREKE